MKLFDKLKYWSLGKKYQTCALNEEYLSCCALAIGVHGAHERIVELKKDDFFKEYPENIDACSEFYNQSFNEVLKHLEDLEKHHLKLLTTISSTTLQQMVYSNELTVFDELLGNMDISEEIHNELSAILHQRNKRKQQTGISENTGHIKMLLPFTFYLFQLTLRKVLLPELLPVVLSPASPKSKHSQGFLH